MFRHTVLHRFLFIVFELFRFGPAVCVSSMAAVFLDIAPSEMFVSSVLFVKTPMSCCVLEKYEAAIFMFVEKGNWTEVQTLCRKEQISWCSFHDCGGMIQNNKVPPFIVRAIDELFASPQRKFFSFVPWCLASLGIPWLFRWNIVGGSEMVMLCDENCSACVEIVKCCTRKLFWGKQLSSVQTLWGSRAKFGTNSQGLETVLFAFPVDVRCKFAVYNLWIDVFSDDNKFYIVLASCNLNRRMHKKCFWRNSHSPQHRCNVGKIQHSKLPPPPSWSGLIFRKAEWELHGAGWRETVGTLCTTFEAPVAPMPMSKRAVSMALANHETLFDVGVDAAFSETSLHKVPSTPKGETHAVCTWMPVRSWIEQTRCHFSISGFTVFPPPPPPTVSGAAECVVRSCDFHGVMWLLATSACLLCVQRVCWKSPVWSLRTAVKLTLNWLLLASGVVQDVWGSGSGPDSRSQRWHHIWEDHSERNPFNVCSRRWQSERSFSRCFCADC